MLSGVCLHYSTALMSFLDQALLAARKDAIGSLRTTAAAQAFGEKPCVPSWFSGLTNLVPQSNFVTSKLTGLGRSFCACVMVSFVG